MKFLFKNAIVFVLLFSFGLFAAPQTYSKVQIHFQNTKEIGLLSAAGLIFDHGYKEKNPAGGFDFRVVLNASEMEILKKSGLPFTVLIPDLRKAYNQRTLSSAPQKTTDTPAGFEYGSMGGYYTFSEVETELDSMYLNYPDLITQKTSIGTTENGNPLWMVKISANPTMDEDEPEVLYTALHHAREPESIMQLIYFMDHILEQYGTDPEITYVLNNRELFFIPVVNPDGYLYNQQTDPNGGGYWRKNRRNNGDGSYGVDLNRNYGYEWGYDDNGSSPTPSSDTYRGPFAFSEPETQAIRDFCENRHFKLALNYHTYSNLLIVPWGYIGDFKTPDSLTYDTYGADMTQYNHYTYGTGNQTVGYLVNGDSDDWMYGEQTTKNKIFAFTPEVGTDADGFWPPQNRIIPLAEENVYPNTYVARVAGGYAKYSAYTVQDKGNGNGYVDAGEEADLFFTIRNIGQGTSKNVSLTLSSSDPNINVLTTQATTPQDLASGAEFLSSAFTIRVDGSTPAGYEPELTLTVSDDGLTTDYIIDDLVIGTPEIVFADSAEHGTGNWDTGIRWNVTTSAKTSGQYAFTDSPVGNYHDEETNALTLKNALSLPAANSIYLRFATKWDIEAEWDFAKVRVSTNGTTWTTLQGKYTEAGSGKGEQSSSEYGYDGRQAGWVDEQFDLTSYAEHDIFLRFELNSDQNTNGDGWYLDEIRIEAYSDAPSALGSKNGQLPRTTALEQNYPNPFNPTTEIHYTIGSNGTGLNGFAARQHVELAVYNMLGQKVAELVNSEQAPGTYSVIFNGTVLPSGIYYYRLKIGTRLMTRKMVLVR